MPYAVSVVPRNNAAIFDLISVPRICFWRSDNFPALSRKCCKGGAEDATGKPGAETYKMADYRRLGKLPLVKDAECAYPHRGGITLTISGPRALAWQRAIFLLFVRMRGSAR